MHHLLHEDELSDTAHAFVRTRILDAEQHCMGAVRMCIRDVVPNRPRAREL